MEEVIQWTKSMTTKRPAAKAKRGRVKCWAYSYRWPKQKRSHCEACSFLNKLRIDRKRDLAIGWECSPIVPITLPLPAPGKARRT